MATINDVAKLAGVSKMTVSRVINNSGYVKKETRQLVLEVIEKLNFRPNMIAKSLVTKRSRIIAHVMLDISDPFHNLVNRGLESYCFQHGYITMLCDAHSKSREQDYINMFVDRSIDGVVFQQLAITDKQVYMLEKEGVKCVLLDNEQEYQDIYRVNTNQYRGGMMAADYLVAKGHRRIGCIYGVTERPKGDAVHYVDTFQYEAWRQRTRGFLDSLRKNKLYDGYLYSGNGLEDVARECIPGILDDLLRKKNRPTAVYCENDIMAIALLNAMKERNLRAPDDLAIVGHDGLSLCHMLHPYITTIAQPRYEMGFQSAVMLMQRLENKEAGKKILLEPELIAGETA
ncbi:MAG: LacI family transcriptional regulator [Treponema sp.]|jgi:DNA-binding LacI/PurR family transcriptional regulator|nr:LacI family transcriptional regulator [Treponema sp.]